MRRSSDAELSAMTRALGLLSPLTNIQRSRVLAWLSERIAELPEPQHVLPGQLPLFDSSSVARVAVQVEQAFAPITEEGA